MLLGSLTSVSREFQWKNAGRVVQRCFKEFSRVFLGIFKEVVVSSLESVTRKIEDVLRVYQGYFIEVSGVFKGGFNGGSVKV